MLSFFYLFFRCFFSVSRYVKQFLGGLHLCGEVFVSFLRGALYRSWKKKQVQIIVLNKNFVKISRISNSKSPPWNVVKFRSEFFLVCWTFLVWLWIIGKIINSPGFDVNADLQICAICLKLDMSSLTEIQYLKIEPSVRRTYTNETMML